MKEIIQNYIYNLEALKEFVELIEPYLHNHLSEILERCSVDLLPFVMYIKEGCTDNPETLELAEQLDDELYEKFKELLMERCGNDLVLKKEKSVVENGISEKNVKSFKKSFELLIKTEKQAYMLYKTALVNLASSSEWFISEILHKYFEKYPSSINKSEKNFSLEELNKFDSIQEAINSIICSKVEEITRGSFEDWINFFKKKTKLKLPYMKDDFYKVVEIFQRRNLIVHNGAIVNEIYLSKVPAELVHNKLSKNDSIIVDREYLMVSIESLKVQLLLLALELWSKLEPKCEERCDYIIELSYKYLCEEDYFISKMLSHFLMTDSKAQENSKMIGKMNYWLSFKLSGKYDEIKADVEAEDFSAKSEILKVCSMALKDDFDNFFEYLPILLKSDQLTYEELSEWPIFNSIRKDDRYTCIIENLKPNIYENQTLEIYEQEYDKVN